MKSLLILLALTVSVAASAQQYKGNRDNRQDNRQSLNDGSTIIRIEVGNENNSDSRQMAQRISRLEKAVRELQNRIYDLEDDARQPPPVQEVTVVTCTLPSALNGTFIGKASSDNEARANAMNACVQKNLNVFWCQEKQKCTTTVERR